MSIPPAGRRLVSPGTLRTAPWSGRHPTVPVRVESSGPWQQVGALLKTWMPNLAVVGLPYNADGSESTLTGAARRFAAQLTERFSIEVRMVDERYSSIDAQARLKQQRASGARRRRIAKGDIDAAAACVILERWFSEGT